ncbi:MAG: DUF4139 domain-containing protein [Flavobacteriales bacterium]|nr:DUF4139 domain-containing protein [Flavobacteriales bacterium]
MRLPHLALSTFLLCSFHAIAAEGEKPITSKVSEVKVFLSGAQVSRTASSSVPSGTSTFVFTGLAQGIDPQSIQVTGKGGYSILSVNHRINYLTESPKKKEIEDLQAKIKKLEKDWAFEKAMQDVWANEEQLLGKNSVVGGQQNGLTATQLTAVNDYIRQRLIATKTNWLAQQEKLVGIQQEKEKLVQQMQQYQAQAPRPTSEIVVEISSTVEVSASFTLTYFLGNAGWVPAYDLRAKGVGQPIDLLMKAQVTNNTGEDWNKVDMSLSSGNPTLGGVMPAMNPWTLYVAQLNREQTLSTRGMRAADSDKAGSFARPSVASGAEVSLKEMEETPASYTWAGAVNQRTTTVEFVIETPFTVPSDGTPHMIGVQNHSIPATYKHYATPKLDKDAFLYARTTGWEDLNLLPGQANVFFEGTFVGESYLQLDIPKDTLEISLGRDKGVTVERVRRKSTNEKATIGSKRTITVGWDITVRNTKGTAVDLELRDQYPLSPQSEIEVKLEENGGGVVDENKGSLTWNFRVEPKATKKLGFSYTVKHPKDLPVVVE